ncbi:Dihydrofolate reductase [Arthrobacter sp. 49Tsu3.1M3]|jgi:dihydrofolate reductase|uniref:dihydrofolate reductase family protein n=1 Tax=unclassified Arthrobacter TaxID=235627 RepID=UPI0009A5C827|nr:MULTISPECIES: dihydrofolate reductase family protein [unclassified Arthrobacter]GIU56551.1 deaminase reductase [Arthrobacter sp. NicSoilC12]SKB52492.1 Dihydrofolate reductase [Arthrobacter sp. 49Tsu3.1M3]
MRKLTAGLFCSVDGVVEDPFKWQFDSFDEELGAGMGEMMGRIDTALLGRVGYQQWAEYWPNAESDADFAGFINPLPKFVASRTLTGELEWQNSRLIEGPLEDFVAALKNSDGGEIGIFSSISLVHQLLFAGLLDTLMLIVHPVIAGSGRRLFNDGDALTRLELQSSQQTSKGNMILSYGLRRD